MNRNIICTIKKTIKFIIIIIFSLTISNCSNTKISELENLLDKYCGNENKVILNKKYLILKSDNSFLKTVTKINISEVDNISYYIVEENGILPHIITINCSSNESVEVKSYIVHLDKERKTIYRKIHYLLFTDKKACLDAKKILEEILKIGKE